MSAKKKEYLLATPIFIGILLFFLVASVDLKFGTVSGDGSWTLVDSGINTENLIMCVILIFCFLCISRQWFDLFCETSKNWKATP
jgi:hypothetical protein